MHSVQRDYVGNFILFYNFIVDYIKEKRNNEKIILNLQRYVGRMIVDAPKMMGFDWKTFPVRYYHPFSKSLKGKIIILGAGDVGKDYYREIKAEYGAENVLWTDRDWRKIKNNIPEIISMDEALRQDYDVIVLAIKSEVRAGQMKEMLLERGVNLEKVIWESPIILSEY
jgi:lactate dehydrogenase-like 2-hydroxyacid dehydrogenase